MIRKFMQQNTRQVLNQQLYRNYSTLVVCEHLNKKLANSSLTALNAASHLKKDVTALVAGTEEDKEVAEQVAKTAGVKNVVFVKSPELAYQSAEVVQKALEQVINGKDDLTHVIAPHTMWGKNLLPRLGAVYNSQPITDVIQIENEKTFVRPVYAGDALTVVESQDARVFMTTRTAAFDKVEGTQDAVSIEEQDLSEVPANKPTFIKSEISKSDRPELADANIVISGGRGMKNGENFAVLEELADKIGAAVGASRAAVDAGWVPNDMQVGQTGKVVAPDLYIACGISGQIQHVAGMKDSKCIVAINKDEEAPFFQIADYGLVADLFTAVPELSELVEKNKE